MPKEYLPRKKSSLVREQVEVERSERAGASLDPRPDLSIEEYQRLTHELDVHQIELEMQNEELQETQEKLLASLDRYSDLFDFAPIGYFILNQNGLILDVNLAGAELLGSAREQLRHKSFYPFITLEHRDAFHLYVRRLFALPERRRAEFALQKADGSHFYVQLDGALIPNVQGEPDQFRVAISDITERRQAEAEVQQLNAALEQRVAARTRELEAALREKEILLQEVHHRVKNSLQAISTLLYLQTVYIENASTRSMLLDTQQRVKAIALMHEKLYQSNNLDQVNFAEYIHSLTAQLIRTYQVTLEPVTLKISAADVTLTMEMAHALGIMVHELVSNCLKHAFPPGRASRQASEIDIWIELEAGQWLVLTVADNGVGLPEGLEPGNARSLGLQLVNLLSQQMQAAVEVTRHNGTTFKVKCPLSVITPQVK